MSGAKIDQRLGALRSAVADVLASAQASRTEVQEMVDQLAELVRKMRDLPMGAAEPVPAAPEPEPPKRKKLKAVKKVLKKTRRKK